MLHSGATSSFNHPFFIPLATIAIGRTLSIGSCNEQSTAPDAAQVELGTRFQSALHHALLVFLLLLTFFPFFIAILTSLKSF